MDTVIVFIIVAAAGYYVGRGLWRALRSDPEAASGCGGGCPGCSGSGCGGFPMKVGVQGPHGP